MDEVVRNLGAVRALGRCRVDAQPMIPLSSFRLKDILVGVDQLLKILPLFDESFVIVQSHAFLLFPQLFNRFLGLLIVHFQHIARIFQGFVFLFESFMFDF